MAKKQWLDINDIVVGLSHNFSMNTLGQSNVEMAAKKFWNIVNKCTFIY